MIEERAGAAFELGEYLTVIGRELAAGDPAPQFTLENLDPATNALTAVNLSDSAGKVRILNLVNSLDTPVCHVETTNWDKLSNQLPENTVVYTISMDLPFAQARWQSSEGVKHQMLSAHKNEDFGRNYGALIKEWRLLQRVVVVIDPEDRVVYTEYVPDQMTEPNYDQALEAVSKVAAS